MTMITTKNNIDYKYLFLAFLGFLIGVFIFWNRLLRDRLARDIALYYTNNFLFCILCLIIIFFVCLSIFAYINIKKVNDTTEKTFFQKFILKVTNTQLFVLWSSFIHSPKIFYDFLTKYTDIEGFIAYFAEVILYKVIVFFAGKSKAPFYIFFVLVPRIIVLIIFYIDIFVYHQLFYFYKSLILLIIPIIFKSIVYMTKALSQKNIDFFMLHIDYTHIDEDHVSITLKKEQPRVEDAFDITDISILPYIIEVLNIYSNILNFCTRIEEKETEIKLYDQLFLSLAYLIGWCSVLYIAFNVC